MGSIHEKLYRRGRSLNNRSTNTQIEFIIETFAHTDCKASSVEVFGEELGFFSVFFAVVFVMIVMVIFIVMTERAISSDTIMSDAKI